MRVRVNLLGIPYSGKSYCATHLVGKIRAHGLVAEYIEEPFKDMFYRGHPRPDFFIEGREFFDCVSREIGRLDRGVQVLVNDSGLWTVLYYLDILNTWGLSLETFVQAARIMDRRYKTYNVVVHPLLTNQGENVGRWDASLASQESRFASFKRFVDANAVEYVELPVSGREAILDKLVADICGNV